MGSEVGLADPRSNETRVYFSDCLSKGPRRISKGIGGLGDCDSMLKLQEAQQGSEKMQRMRSGNLSIHDSRCILRSEGATEEAQQ